MLRFLTLVLIATLSVTAAAEEKKTQGSEIGTLLAIEGEVLVAPGDANPVPAKAGTALYEHDRIETGPDARALILLSDDTHIRLATETTLTLDSYVYDSENPKLNKGRFTIAGRGFEYVSGVISRSEKPDVKIIIPQGEITAYRSVFQAGIMDDGYNIYTEKGRVMVQTKRGQAHLKEGQATVLHGFAPTPTRPVSWSPANMEQLKDSVLFLDEDDVKTLLAKSLKAPPEKEEPKRKAPSSSSKPAPTAPAVPPPLPDAPYNENGSRTPM